MLNPYAERYKVAYYADTYSGLRNKNFKCVTSAFKHAAKYLSLVTQGVDVIYSHKEPQGTHKRYCEFHDRIETVPSA